MSAAGKEVASARKPCDPQKEEERAEKRAKERVEEPEEEEEKGSYTTPWWRDTRAVDSVDCCI